jgi:hypothetical protein
MVQGTRKKVLRPQDAKNNSWFAFKSFFGFVFGNIKYPLLAQSYYPTITTNSVMVGSSGNQLVNKIQ